MLNINNNILRFSIAFIKNERKKIDFILFIFRVFFNLENVLVISYIILLYLFIINNYYLFNNYIYKTQYNIIIIIIIIII